MTAAPPRFVPVTFWTDPAQAARIREAPDRFREVMARAGDGTFSSVVRVVLGDGPAAAPATGSGGLPPSVPVRLDLHPDIAAGLLAPARAAAIGARLDRIADELAAVNARLDGVQAGIDRIDANAGAMLRIMRQEPLAALRAARTSAAVAFRRGDNVTLAAAARDSHAAAHRLINVASALAGDGADGPTLPLALRAPAECAEILEQAGIALLAAGAIYVALGARDEGAALVREGAEAIGRVRDRLRDVLTDPAALALRLSASMAPDDAVMGAGRRLASAVSRTNAEADAIATGVAFDAGGFLALGNARLAALHLVADLDH